MKKIKNTCCVFLLVSIAFSVESFGQDTEFIGLISENTDKTVYTAMQNIWLANEKITYIAFLPAINNQIHPKIPLQEGEGKNKKYVFEASIFDQVPLLMGRNHSGHFWQTSRVTIDFGFNVRMAQDNSNPLVPNNNIIGFSVQKYIWNSHTKFGSGDTSHKYVFDNWYDSDTIGNNLPPALHTLSLDFSAHHYSNGQQGSFFTRDTINRQPERRNNYKDGDFSTNYLRLGLTYSYLTPKRNLVSGNLSYQYDGSLFGPLVFSTEQKNSYGQNRLQSFLQYRKSFNWGVYKNVSIQKICKDSVVKKDINIKHELILRWESEYILDKNLSDYISTNQKHRFNQHLYLKYTQRKFRAVGFVVHAYYGRDYSNIRYDMPIFALMGGISIDFHKYIVPFSKKQLIK